MTPKAAPATPTLFWRVMRVLAIIIGAQVVALNADWLINLAGLTEHGSFGFQSRPALDRPVGSMELLTLDQDGAAARAGVVLGDRLRLIRAERPGGTPQVGDRLEFEVEHAGQRRRVSLVAEASRAIVLPGDAFGQAVNLLANGIAAALGVLILLRGRTEPTVVMLGLALGSFGLSFEQVGPLLSHAPFLWLANAVISVDVGVQYGAFLAFGLMVLGAVDGNRRWRWILLGAFAAVLTVFFLEGNLTRLFFNTVDAPALAWRVFALGQTTSTWGVMLMGSLAGTAAALGAAWVRSRGEERRRIALLNLAFGGILLNQTWIVIVGLRSHGLLYDHLGDWDVLVADFLAGVVAPALFAYAILRHRVIDLGFAVNRTLVYSTVSAIMLAAFGLIEWAVDHFTQIEGREQNALVDAAIALGVFLTFHRVRDFVEHAIETLFFRRWRAKEDEMRAAVADAAFITKPSALLNAAVTAVGRFAEGRGCVFYLSAVTGYERAAGQAPDAPGFIDADDPALVRLRASLKPVAPADTGSALPGELMCPMVHRKEVFGLALIAPRADQQPLRPDEIDLLAWAVQQLGLDLHALKVEALEVETRQLRTELDGAQDLLGRLGRAAV